MQGDFTRYFERLIKAYNSGYRRIVSMGGTSSSKTYSELQLLYQIAIARHLKKRPVVISVVSESLPHLKLGAIRDFEGFLRRKGLYDDSQIDHTNHKYYFGDSFIEFFAADIGKATGPRRNILLLNEVNNIPLPVVRELVQRTDETIFYDFNPTEDFWISEEVFTLPSREFILLKSNHLDNDYLSPAIRREIELRADRDPNYRRVHIDVEFGSNEGLIFRDWKLCDAMPATDKRIIGVDFGFTNDPTVITDVRQNGGEWWADEVIYQTGMHNNDIARVIKSLNLPASIRVVCDSADPKSIDDLKRMGIRAEPCVKGPDSIRNGIDHINSMPLNVTRRSVNAHKELRNYRWRMDKSGKSMNEPVDMWNHFIDSLRYGASGFKNSVPIKPARYSY